jgi:hypothetical protein
MDARGRIYHGEDVPPEDEARLDGYLRGRAEAELLLDVKKAAYETKIRELEEAQRRAQGDG